MVHSFLLFSHRIVNLQMLEIQSVTKQYGRFVANNSISLTINSGTIFGLLGPNGAGKTTLIRMITNITTPDSGTILLNGQPVAEVAHNRIGYLPEERGLYKKLTVREQLTYFGMLKGMSAAEMRTSLNTWLDRLDARGWENKKISELSKGMQQKVQFISAVQHAPALVILDEPFTGLDPVNAQLLINTVRTLRSENVTVILSTHQMDQVEKLCDDIALINFGSVVLNGNLREIKSRFRSNHIIFEYSGEGEIPAMTGVGVEAKADGRVELKFDPAVQTPHGILRILAEHLEISRFEVTEPSLNQIFVETVTTADAGVPQSPQP